jgi:type IV pilus assembly protein PilM
LEIALLYLFGKKPKLMVLGLDISSTTVKLLELSRTGERYRVESYGVASLPVDAVIEKNVNDVVGVSKAISQVVPNLRRN